MSNPQQWQGMKYPDSNLVSLICVTIPKDERTRSKKAIVAGCGAGRHIRLLYELGFFSYGIDNDPEMVKLAEANCGNAFYQDVLEYIPRTKPFVVVAWGLFMLCPKAAVAISKWGAEYIFSDWRTPYNSCCYWARNKKDNDDDGIVLANPSSHLDGLKYYFHYYQDCNIPGYEIISMQTVSVKRGADDVNEWFQTVHRRTR
jgi:SAM-dependent methyltransferase